MDRFKAHSTPDGRLSRSVTTPKPRISAARYAAKAASERAWDLIMLPPVCRRPPLFLLSMLFSCALFAAGDPTECPPNAEGIASQVKTILGPRYATDDDPAALADSFQAMEILLLQAGHCSAAARSHGAAASDRERNIMEWHSMNQWLSRLVGMMGRNMRGDIVLSWRDEYLLFAEIYEFEP